MCDPNCTIRQDVRMGSGAEIAIQLSTADRYEMFLPDRLIDLPTLPIRQIGTTYLFISLFPVHNYRITHGPMRLQCGFHRAQKVQKQVRRHGLGQKLHNSTGKA